MAWIQFVMSLLCMLWLGSSLFCLSCVCVCYGLDPVCSVSHVYVMAWIQFVLSLMCMLWLGSSLFCLLCVCYGLDPVCSVAHVYAMTWIQFVLLLMCMLWLGSSLFCLSCVCYGLDPVCSVSPVYVMAWIQFVLSFMCMLWLGSSLSCLSCVCYGLDPHSRSACILTMGQEVYSQEKQAHPGCTLPEPLSTLPHKNNTLLPSSLPHLVRLQVTRSYAGAGFCLRVDPPADPVVGPPWPQHFSPGLPKVAGGVPDSPTESEEFSPLLHTT